MAATSEARGPTFDLEPQRSGPSSAVLLKKAAAPDAETPELLPQTFDGTPLAVTQRLDRLGTGARPDAAARQAQRNLGNRFMQRAARRSRDSPTGNAGVSPTFSRRSQNRQDVGVASGEKPSQTLSLGQQKAALAKTSADRQRYFQTGSYAVTPKGPSTTESPGKVTPALLATPSSSGVAPGSVDRQPVEQLTKRVVAEGTADKSTANADAATSGPVADRAVSQTAPAKAAQAATKPEVAAAQTKEAVKKEAAKGADEAVAKGPPESEAVAKEAVAETVKPAKATGLKATTGGVKKRRGGGGPAPELKPWKAQVSQATSQVEPAPTDSVESSPEKLAEEGKSLDAKRQAEKPDYLADGKKKISPTPEVEDPPPQVPEEDPVPEALEGVQKASGKRLSDQALPALERSPGHADLDGGRGRLPRIGAPPPQPAPATEKSTESGAAAGGQGEAKVDPQAEQMTKDLAAAADLQPQSGSAEGVTLRDEGPPTEVPLASEIKGNISDALAAIMLQSGSHAERFVGVAMRNAYPKGILAKVAPELAKPFKKSETTAIDAELKKVGEAAGIADKDLQAKVDAGKKLLAATGETVAKDLESKSGEAQGAVEKRGADQQKAIGDASATVQLESERKQEAAVGSADPGLIESKKNRLIVELEKEAGESYAAYRRAGELRQKQLRQAKNDQLTAYNNTAKAEIADIRRLYKLPDEKIKAGLASFPTQSWRAERDREVRKLFTRLELAAQDEVKSLQGELSLATLAGKAQIRQWADDKLDQDRSWWEKILDLFSDWFSQAEEDRRAWEKERAGLTKDEVVEDFQALGKLRDAIATKNQAEIDKALASLSADQQVLAQAFFQSGGNSIAAVATAIVVRLQGRHVPELVEKLQKESLKLELPVLIDIAKAEDPKFNPYAILGELYDAINGAGTKDKKLFKQLEGRTVVQATVLKQLYAQENDGADLETALKEEYEWDIFTDDDEIKAQERRIEAALSGDRTSADAAALRASLVGAGTDEATVMSVLRNKTPEEREKVIHRFEELYGIKLKDAIDDDMDDFEQDRTFALLEGNIAKADAVAMEQAMHDDLWGADLGMDADPKEIEAVYLQIRKEVEDKADREGMTTAELEAEIVFRNRQVAQAYNVEYQKPLETAFTSDIEAEEERNLALAMAKNDRTGADAARIRIEEKAILYTSDAAVITVLRSQHERAVKDVRRDRMVAFKKSVAANPKEWTPEKIKAELKRIDKEVEAAADQQGMKNMKALENRFDKDYSSGWGPGGLQAVVIFHMSGYDQEQAETLMKQGGKLSEEQEIFFATAGFGTNKEKMREVLKGKSKEELAALDQKYQTLTGGRWEGKETLADAVLGDVSGRDDFDFQLLLEGEPKTPDEKLERLKRQRDYEAESGLGLGTALLLSPVVPILPGLVGAREAFSASDSQLLDHRLARAEAALKELKAAEKLAAEDVKDPKEKARRAEDALRKREHYEGLLQLGDYQLTEYREAVDTMTDAAATTAAIVAAVAVVVASGGTATPAVAAGAAAAAGTAGVSVKLTMKGQAYGWEDIATDLGVTAVDALAAATTAGIGNALLRSGRLAQMAKGPLVSRLAAHATAEGLENLIGSLPAGLVENLLNEQSWQHGNVLEKILTGLAAQGILAGGLGAGLGSLGGFRLPGFDVPSVPGKAGDVADPHLGKGLPAGDVAVPAPKVDADGLDVPGSKAPDTDVPGAPGGSGKQAPAPSDDLPPGVKKIEDTPSTKALKEDPELTAALPKDLQGKVPVKTDPDLPGNTVEVRYHADNSGVVRGIEIRVGPLASVVDIDLHVGTVRLMEKYMGISGHVRELLRRVKAWIGKHGEPPVGSRAWEAKLEIEKLPRIIDERMRRLAKGDLSPDEKVDLLAEIFDLQAQLKRHRQTLDDMDLDPGVGFVAAGVNDDLRTKFPKLLEESPAVKDLYGSWEEFFEHYTVRFRDGRYGFYSKKGAPKRLELRFAEGHEHDLGHVVEIIDRTKKDRSHKAVKGRIAEANKTPLGDFPELEAALVKKQQAMTPTVEGAPPRVESDADLHPQGWSAEDAGYIRNYGALIKKLHESIAELGDVPDSFFKSLLELPADYGRSAADAFRERLRQQIGKFLAEVPDGGKRMELLEEFLKIAYDTDPKSKGEFFSAFRGERLKKLTGDDGTFSLLPATGGRQLEGAVSEGGVDPPLIDGAISVDTAPKGEGAPPFGKYAVEDKAGYRDGLDPRSSKQSKIYSTALESGGGTVKAGDTTYQGVIYFFDNLDAAKKALDNDIKKIGEAGAHHEKIFIGYFDEAGNLQWLPRKTKTLKRPGSGS